MNLLNQQLRAVRVQLANEEKKTEPDNKVIELLKKEEQECLRSMKLI